MENDLKRLILPTPFALVEIFRTHVPFYSSSSSFSSFLHSSFSSIVRTKTECRWTELNRGSCRVKEIRFFTWWHHNETQSRKDACRRVYTRASAGCRCFFLFFCFSFLSSVSFRRLFDYRRQIRFGTAISRSTDKQCEGNTRPIGPRAAATPYTCVHTTTDRSPLQPSVGVDLIKRWCKRRVSVGGAFPFAAVKDESKGKWSII